MADIHYREYVDSILSRKFQRAIVPWMEEAHKLVQMEMSRDFYRFPTAKKNTGNLVNIAIDGCLVAMIERGLLEAEYEFAAYPKSPQKYLKIISNGVMAVHCRISKPMDFVRPALHRDYQRLANIKVMQNRQVLLSLGPQYLPEELGPIPEHPLLVLTHSTKGFTFANISLAHYRDKSWLYQTPDLRQELHVAADDLPKAERPDPQALQLLLRNALAEKEEPKQDEQDRGPDTGIQSR